MGDQELVEDLPASSLRSDNLKENNSEERTDNVTPTEKEKSQENGTPLIETEIETEIQSDGDKDGSTTGESKIQEDLQESEDPEKPQEEPEEVLGPDDVICDSCIDRPCRAKKSCLTCLVSYCESHLRPHLENVKFQSHKLVDPLRDIERLTCESHGCPLELFCCADTCCVCQDCMIAQHRGHDTLPITEARRKIEVQHTHTSQFLPIFINLFIIREQDTL